MKQLAAIYSAELLKLKRSIALQLTFLIPLLIILLMIGTLLNKHPENYDQKMFSSMLQSVYVSWLILVLPLFVAIETGLISGSEQISSQWKHIFCLSIARGKILFAKWLVEVTVLTAANLTLTVLFVLAFPILRACMPEINFIFFLCVQDMLTIFWQICVSTLGIASLHFAFSLLLPGLVPAIGLAITAVTFSIGITYSSVGVELFPWTLPMVSVANYVNLELTLSTTKALATSLIVSMLCCVIAIPAFVRKDVL